MNVLIVDDEAHARENLELLLKKHFSEIKTIETASSVDEGLALFKSMAPDIVFLDISMPEKDGFEMLEEIQPLSTSIIFVTAHQEFALRAIQCGPTGYLLKPLILENLKEAIERAKLESLLRNKYKDEFSQGYNDLKLNLKKKKKPHNIVLQHSGKVEIVQIIDILYLNSEGSYTHFKLTNNTTIIMSKNLKYYENLVKEDFFRIHRSYSVNKKHIVSFEPTTGYIILSNNEQIEVSQRKKSNVLELVNSLHK